MTKQDSDSSDNPSFGLKRNEIIRSKKHLAFLFKNAEYLKSGCIALLIAKNPPFSIENDSGFLVGFSVPKKNIKRANKRNYIKRRMREAFRLNKHEFQSNFASETYFFMLIYRSTKINSYQTIESDIQKCFAKMKA